MGAPQEFYQGAGVSQSGQVKLRKIPLSVIQEARYTQGKSVIPDSMNNGLSDQDFHDLISHLRSFN